MLDYDIANETFNPINLVLKIIKRIYQYTLRFMKSVKFYCQKNSANIFTIVGEILHFTNIVFYLIYLLDSDRINFETADKNNYESIGIMNQFKYLTDTYSDILSVLMFISFIKILVYFGFSEKLEIVISVISDAKLDFFFFFVIFFILLIIFAIIGMTIFG